jgi:UDP-3-O-[3-hydroxymyristoyl] glucosamine N-acyltransferase
MITRTVSQLAELCGATLEGDGERVVTGPATLREATPEQVSFLVNPAYAPEVEETAAGAVIVPLDFHSRRADLPLLRSENPNRAFSRVVEVFQPELGRPEPGVHASAQVSENAQLGAGVSIGALCVVGSRAVLEDGVVLHARVTVGAACRVGSGSVLYPGAVLYPGIQVGERCLIHAGAVIGADGFGFDPTPQGWEKVPQCGTVVVEDDVEIGANTTVDRGRFGATRIGRGTKIDNLVMIGHNVEIGPGALLVGQVGISGSTKVGRGAILGGQVGVVGHITIGDGARVGGQGGVAQSIEGGKDYFGSPVMEKREAFRVGVLQRRLPEVFKRLDELEKRQEK